MCCSSCSVRLFGFGTCSKAYIVRCNIRLPAICLKKDILYMCSTQIQKVKKNMLTIILSASWALFTCYLLWYATSAKRNVPITINDAKMLWKIHKQSANCAGHKWRLITRRSGKIQGFECECGYKYTQIRPLVSSLPKASDQNLRNADKQQRMLSSGYILPEY